MLVLSKFHVPGDKIIYYHAHGIVRENIPKDTCWWQKLPKGGPPTDGNRRPVSRLMTRSWWELFGTYPGEIISHLHVSYPMEEGQDGQ